MYRLNLLVCIMLAASAMNSLIAQSEPAANSVEIRVTNIVRNEYGFLISVEISNHSRRTLFLSESSSWSEFKDRPRFVSLDVEQWSDGRTNLSPVGKKLTPIPPRARYFSVGPCRDAASGGAWIRLPAGKHLSDQIQALDPSLPGIGNSVCPMRFARFGEKLRLTVTAFPSPRSRDKEELTAWTDLPLPQH